MAQNFSVGRPAARGRPPGEIRLSPLFRYGPFIRRAPWRLGTAGIPLGPQVLRQKPLDFLPVLPPQPPQVQHARPRLALVPGRVEPPPIALLLFQAELQ